MIKYYNTIVINYFKENAMFNEFNKIYTFIAIVKERSFSKASRVLNISQPAVTLQIKKLEEILNTTLIIRKKNGILLTKEGDKFYKICEKFENTLRAFKEEAENIKNLKPKLIIAATPILHEAVMPFLLEKITHAFDMELEIKVYGEDMILSYLKEKRCDLCLTNDKFFSDNVICKQYLDYKFLLVSNKAMDSKVYVKDLYKMKFIKDISKKYMSSLFESQSLRYEDLKSAYKLDSTLAVINTLIYNQGEQYCAFIPEFLANPLMEAGQIFEIKVEDITIKRTMYVASLKENEEMLNKFLKVKISD